VVGLDGIQRAAGAHRTDLHEESVGLNATYHLGRRAHRAVELQMVEEGQKLVALEKPVARRVVVAFEEHVDLKVAQVQAEGAEGGLELTGGHVAVRVDVHEAVAEVARAGVQQLLGVERARDGRQALAAKVIIDRCVEQAER